jgi:kynureninase
MDVNAILRFSDPTLYSAYVILCTEYTGRRPQNGFNIHAHPQVLSLVALDVAMDAWDGVDIAAVRAKSVAQCDLFVGASEAQAVLE